MRRMRSHDELLEPLEIDQDDVAPYALCAEAGLAPSAIRRFERARSEPPPRMWAIEEEPDTG